MVLALGVGALMTAFIACGTDRGLPGNNVCAAGGVCPNGTPYQACTSQDGKQCSYQVGGQSFACLSCANCATALAALSAACTTAVQAPVLDFAISNPPPDFGVLGNLDLAINSQHDFGNVDLAHNGPFDFASVKVGCNGYINCLNDCFNANPSATLASCESMCTPLAKATAPTEYNNALDCGQQHCLGNLDMKNGKCILSADATRLLNHDGTDIMSSDPTDGSNPNKDCGRCLNDALARLFNTACDLMSSPDCNPSECKAVTDTCLNDLP
jgi:hypothetical protein